MHLLIFFVFFTFIFFSLFYLTDIIKWRQPKKVTERSSEKLNWSFWRKTTNKKKCKHIFVARHANGDAGMHEMSAWVNLPRYLGILLMCLLPKITAATVVQHASNNNIVQDRRSSCQKWSVECKKRKKFFFWNKVLTKNRLPHFILLFSPSSWIVKSMSLYVMHIEKNLEHVFVLVFALNIPLSHFR